MTDIFQEVEEDYRRDRYRQLAKRWGPYAIAGAVGLVIFTAGYELYKGYRADRMESNAQAFVAAAAQLDGNPRASAEAFGKLAETDTGYGFLSRFRKAEALQAAGDVGGAVKVLDALAAEKGPDKVLADLALLKTGYLLLDRQSRADLETRLAPLLAPGNPWRAEAREILAFAALKSGEQAKALSLFTELAKDAESPATLRNRAASMATALGGQLSPGKAGESQ